MPYIHVLGVWIMTPTIAISLSVWAEKNGIDTAFFTRVIDKLHIREWFMLIFNFIRRFGLEITRTRNSSLFILLLACGVLGYFGFSLAGESNIVSSPLNFIYWSVVTASSLGYGDIYPETLAGKMLLTFYYLPVNFVLFSILIGKMGKFIFNGWNLHMTGKSNITALQGHIILICSTAEKSRKLIQLILDDHNRPDRTIVLLTNGDFAHPFPDNEKIKYLSVDNLHDQDVLNKVCISSADKIAIDLENDDRNFSLAVHYSTKVSENSFIATFIDNEDQAQALRQLNKPIEVLSSNKNEKLVRSLQDSGSDLAFQSLLTNSGQTMHAQEVVLSKPRTVADVAAFIKGNHNAIFIGVANDKLGKTLAINPDDDEVLPVGKSTFLYYIALDRITFDQNGF
ncbi:two pore domain potassium channel family protein [Shewanella psychromarinicola]|uniref:Two pore domain potassium channel family protein n=2 Tax=Shewanellaceae TaxID=267890 RepID=A0A3N4DFL5_9GAMM|nr:two pore domain potassium channel family protein [Shewanella psychromarinicola]RPA23632.1 two pore domain potassium channel family protein [Shewanella psychromarinicola]